MTNEKLMNIMNEANEWKWVCVNNLICERLNCWEEKVYSMYEFDDLYHDTTPTDLAIVITRGYNWYPNCEYNTHMEDFDVAKDYFSDCVNLVSIDCRLVIEYVKPMITDNLEYLYNKDEEFRTEFNAIVDIEE